MSHIKSHHKVTMEGEYTIVVTSETTGKSRTYGPFKNIITDIGLNRLAGASDSWGFFYTGTGTGIPAAGDTNLFTYRAVSNSIVGSVTNTAGSSPDYWTQSTKTLRFAAGVSTGNITEVAVGWFNGNPANAIFSHALIVDGGGTPTTITVLADEFLDITYTFRIYPPIVDTTGTTVIAGVNHNYIVRASRLPWLNSAGALLTGGWSGNVVSGRSLVYTGDIGAMTSIPAGTSMGVNAATFGTYTPGSYTLNINTPYGLTEGNLVGGIRSTKTGLINVSGILEFQTQFDPKIPKDNTKILTFTHSITWARRP